MTVNAPEERAALVVAHPGHELCVYGWLERARPRVFVLTNGAGRSGTPRLASTTKILSQAAAVPGSIYGRFADLDIYAAVLEGDSGLFERLIVELAEAFVREEIESVAGDAIEGYNPAHDVCRLVIDAAVELARRTSGRPIVNRDFLLFGRHNTHPEELRATAVWLELDDEMLARKLQLARAYPELRNEIDALLDKKALETLRAFPELSAHVSDFVTSAMGSEAYRVECLRLVSNPARGNGAAKEVPFYERYGELLVAAGVYRRAIRYRDHIMPLAEALRRFIDARH